nr:putative ankyrin 1 [Tranosema rostrale ichnovirus]
MELSKIEELFATYSHTGNTIFHDLAEYGALRLLQRIRDRIDPPFHAIQRKNYSDDFCVHSVVKWHGGLRAIDLLEVLVQMGADLNARGGRSGDTALHMTTYDGDCDLALWLCRQPQIDVHVRNHAGLTAYELAVKKKNERLMAILCSSSVKCETPEISKHEESDTEGA